MLIIYMLQDTDFSASNLIKWPYFIFIPLYNEHGYVKSIMNVQSNDFNSCTNLYVNSRINDPEINS